MFKKRFKSSKAKAFINKKGWNKPQFIPTININISHTFDNILIF